MGMFLFSMILGAFLIIVDNISSHLPENLAAAIIAVPAMALVNSALFTSLLTHGLILAVVLIWLLRSIVERQSRLDKTRSFRVGSKWRENQEIQIHIEENLQS